MAFSSSIVKTKRDGSVKIIDGTGTPNELILQLEVGDFTWEETRAADTVIRDRGVIAGVRKADDAEINLSFTIHADALTDSTDNALWDWLYFRGAAAGHTSTGGTGYEGNFVTIKYIIDATSLGDPSDYAATFSKVRCTVSFTEGDPSSIAVSGVCYGGVAYT